MKKYLVIALTLLISLTAAAKNNIKLKIEGPENQYNLVKVINMTSFSDYNFTLYLLAEQDGKMVVSSALTNSKLKGNGDSVSVKVKLRAGQWLGVSLPDGMDGVKAVMTYKDLPGFDMIYITLTEEKVTSVGEEF